MASLAVRLLSGLAALHSNIAFLPALEILDDSAAKNSPPGAGVTVIGALVRALCFYLCHPPVVDSLVVDIVHALHAWILSIPPQPHSIA